MCLWLDDDGDWEYLRGGTRTARIEHRCDDCGRTIDPGETYEYVTGINHADGRPEDVKTCRHCAAVATVGSKITGCPRAWTAGLMYDRDPEIGFVANLLHDEDHDLTDDQRALFASWFDLARTHWTGDSTDELVDVPEVPA